MSGLHHILTTAIFLFVGITHAGLNPEQFKNPPAEARPMTWMHMMNGNASKEGLEADLKALHDAGVGGALIFSIAYQGIPEGASPFNSQQFRDVLSHGIDVADELGLKIGLHNCDGWSSSGGPWVSVEESMKQLVWNDTVVAGGAVRAQIPQPEMRYDYYRDIAVLAIPATAEDLKASKLQPKVTCLAGDREARKLFDGDLLNAVNMKVNPRAKESNKQSLWIQFEYEKPFPARSVLTEHTMRDGTCTLLASQDGVEFKKVIEIDAVRPGKHIWANEATFPEVKARFFRFEYTGALVSGFR